MILIRLHFHNNNIFHLPLEDYTRHSTSIVKDKFAVRVLVIHFQLHSLNCSLTDIGGLGGGGSILSSAMVSQFFDVVLGGT